MGLTIHYDLKFQGTAEEARVKLQEISRVARALSFKNIGKIWELDYSKDFNNDEENKRKAGEDEDGYRWAKIQSQPRGDWIGRTRYPNKDGSKYKGYTVELWAGEGCEPTNLGLISKDGRNWRGHAFTKTQYAEHFVGAHLLVITILDVCKKLGILKSVSDEGDYWETRDLSLLGGNITESTKAIKKMHGDLKRAFKHDRIVGCIDECENYMTVKKEVKKRNKTKHKNCATADSCTKNL